MNVKKRFLIKLMQILGFGSMAAYCTFVSSCSLGQTSQDGLSDKQVQNDESASAETRQPSEQNPAIAPTEEAPAPLHENNSGQIANNDVNADSKPDQIADSAIAPTDPASIANDQNADTADASVENNPIVAKILQQYKRSTEFSIYSRNQQIVVVETKGGMIAYPADFYTIVEDAKKKDKKYKAVFADGTIVDIPDKMFKDRKTYRENCSPNHKYGCIPVTEVNYCTYNKDKKEHDCLLTRTGIQMDPFKNWGLLLRQ